MEEGKIGFRGMVRRFFAPAQEAKVIRQEPPPQSNMLFAWSYSYNGEKNLGEAGPIKEYDLDYAALTARSWQCYLESEIAQMVLNKFNTWVIGSGLKLIAEPAKQVLKSEKIEFDSEAFNEEVESRFAVWAKSRSSSHSKEQNLHTSARDAFKSCTVGGDSLIVLRYEKKQITVQVIDGAHVQNPLGMINGQEMESGATLCNGVEISAEGSHVAYHVRTGFAKFVRVEAKSKTGLRMAYLVYGSRYRLDNHRGIPLISTVIETLKKLERYKEATVGSAEERQKIVFAIEHDATSTGENPLQKSLVRGLGNGNTDEIPVTQQGQQLADKFVATTNKQMLNMPIGSKLAQLASTNELHFKDFYSQNIDLICAAVGIPPEVALSKYDSNYSASRAANKDWEHTIKVTREYFAFQFYQPIYEFWLHIQVMTNKVQAMGYLTAFQQGNSIVMDAYRNARFNGVSVPNIDPLKEVKAEREKLGSAAAHIPLTTVEQAVESLGGGDSDSIADQFAEELKQMKELGVEPQQQTNGTEKKGKPDDAEEAEE
jgi:capsid protein